MTQKLKSINWKSHRFVLPVLLIFLGSAFGLVGSIPNEISAEVSTPLRRVNVPYFGTGPPVELFEPSIFWMGKVDPTSNYADVRMWYYDEYIKVFVNIIDRLVWYDKNPTTSELAEWDAVSLYLDLDGNHKSTPGSSAYQVVGQLNGTEPRANWQAAYQGNGTSWDLSTLSFPTYRGFHATLNNDINDSGWNLTFIVPFSSLGLSGPPPKGTVWGLGVSVHDRDYSSGSPEIPDQIWPEQMDPNTPSTWGQLHFGRSTYERPDVLPAGTIEIRHNLNGAVVTDAHVGGGFNCGNGVDMWSEWGEVNFTGSTQIIIQNQWQIFDFQCFSKFYITFPLDGVPAAEPIISATLTMNRFSNSGGGQWGEPPNSFIHALTVDEDWFETSINWNNAPLAVENIAGTWVPPVQTSEQVPFSWDVTKAVSEAAKSGQPLRLVFYSIDGDMHSGKYFFSSDKNDWEGAARPRLKVTWGSQSFTQCETCDIIYIPIVKQ